MIDQISYKTKITNVAEDGSVTMKVIITGVTLKVIGDSAAVIFSTIDSSMNETRRSKEYSHVFKFLNNTVFTAEVSPDGTVTSIRGKIIDKIQKVKNLIPDAKVNGKSITFFTNQILSTDYLKNVLSVGWIHREPDQIQKGTVQKEVVETPPIPGNAHADPVSIKPMKKEFKRNQTPSACILKSKAGFGSFLDLGEAAVAAVEGTNMVNNIGMKIQEVDDGAIRTSFKMNYMREKQN